MIRPAIDDDTPPERDPILQRVGVAYYTATQAQSAQPGGRVTINIGEHIRDYLRTTAAVDRPINPMYGQVATLWGFPVFTPDDLDKDAIEVVTTVQIA
jgi:hypothetical protein